MAQGFAASRSPDAATGDLGPAIPPGRASPGCGTTAQATRPPPHVISRIMGSAFLGVNQSATCFKIKPVLKCLMGLGPEYSVACRIEPYVL